MSIFEDLLLHIRIGILEYTYANYTFRMVILILLFPRKKEI